MKPIAKPCGFKAEDRPSIQLSKACSGSLLLAGGLSYAQCQRDDGTPIDVPVFPIMLQKDAHRKPTLVCGNISDNLTISLFFYGIRYV